MVKVIKSQEDVELARSAAHFQESESMDIIEEEDCIIILKMKPSSFSEYQYRIAVAGINAIDELYWNDEFKTYQDLIDEFQVYEMFVESTTRFTFDTFMEELEEVRNDFPNAKIFEISVNCSFVDINGWAKR